MCVYLSSEICARTQKKFRGQNLEVCEGIIHIFNGHYLNIVAFHLVFLFNRFKNKMRMTRNFGPEELGRWGGTGEGVLIFGGRTKGWGWGGRGRAARRRRNKRRSTLLKYFAAKRAPEHRRLRARAPIWRQKFSV